MTTTSSTVSPRTGVPEGYSAVGCFPDSKVRLLDGAVLPMGQQASADYCAEYCNTISQARWYPWIGLEAGGQCFCGDAPTRDVLGPNNGNNSDSCQGYTCSGNSSQYCGGQGYIILYSARQGYTPASVTPRSTSAAVVTVTIGTSGVGGSTGGTSTPPSTIGLAVVVAVLGLALLGALAFIMLRVRRTKQEGNAGEGEIGDVLHGQRLEANGIKPELEGTTPSHPQR